MAEAAKTGELDPKECRQILADAKEVYAPEDLGFRSGGRETDYEWRALVIALRIPTSNHTCC